MVFGIEKSGSKIWKNLKKWSPGGDRGETSQPGRGQGGGRGGDKLPPGLGGLGNQRFRSSEEVRNERNLEERRVIYTQSRWVGGLQKYELWKIYV